MTQYDWVLSVVRFVKQPIVLGIIALVASFLIGKGLVSCLGSPSIAPQSANVTGRPSKGGTLRKLTAKRAAFKTQMGEVKNHDHMVSSSIVRHNVYEFYLEAFQSPDTFKRSGFATFVQGRVFMIPYHFVTQIESYVEDDESYLKSRIRLLKVVDTINGQPSSMEFTIEQLLTGVIYDDSIETMDCVLVALPRQYPTHRSIVKFFMPDSKYVKERDWNVRLLLPYLGECEHVLTKARTLSSPVVSDMTNIQRKFSIPKGFRYPALTRSGDCGGLCTLYGASDNSGVILGFHIAGAKASQVGIANFIPREYIVACLAAVPDEFKVMENMNIIPAYVAEMDVSSYVQFPPVADLPSRFVPEIGVPRPINYNGKTEICRSRLYGQWGKPLTAPARLHPFLREGECINPYADALSKYCTPWVNMDADFIQDAAMSYWEYISSAATFRVDRRVYTFDEAIIGTDDPDFGSIARNTSAGYPITKDVKFKGPKKFSLLGNGDIYDLSTEELTYVKDRVHAVLSDAKASVRALHVFTDNLKDERRPIKKVREGKTRLFSGCPFDYHVAVRQYFGAFSLWFIKNKITNGSAIGVNPYSLEWHDIALRLREKGGSGSNFGAGDYSAYDGSSKPDIHWAILDIINAWYGDSEENKTIRSILWLELVNSRHIRGSLVYSWFSSLPSGHPLTAIVNTMYNNIVMRLAWATIFEDKSLWCLSQFNENVFIICLGDDNLFGVNPYYRKDFNERTISCALKNFGLTYTSELKGEFAEGLRELSEVSFLKRKFRFEDRLQRYVAPLQLDVVLEIPYWTKNILNMREVIEETNLQVSLDELSLHGSSAFAKYAGQMLEAAQSCMGYVPKRFLYNSCLEFISNCDQSW